MLFKDYYLLTKPGIIYGNLLTAAAGFLLAAKGNINPSLLLALLLGTAATVASGCVFNNIIDLEADKIMSRTKNRPLVKKTISITAAYIFGTLLGIVGFLILAFYTSILTLLTGILGFIFYIGIYSFWKKKTIYGTLLGSISGATPPVAGYLAVTNQIDIATVLLFLILVFWQMVHFYAIAIYQLDNYKAAGIPVWPVKKGVSATKIQMLIFAIAFGITLPWLTLLGYTGYSYLIVIIVVFLTWLRLILQGFKTANDSYWARRVFIFSQIVLASFAATLSLDVFLP